MFDLSGRRVLVTGAGQNVGAGIARALAARGAVVAVNDMYVDRAQAVTADIVEGGGAAQALPFDVTDLDAVRSAMASFGPVDVLVNNAGVTVHPPMAVRRFLDTAPADWEPTLRLNVVGVMNCCHVIVPGMVERGWGRVITISSAAGTHGVGIGVASYSAAKGGGLAFTRSLAMEVARSGVTANSLALGLMEQPDPQATERLARSIPVGRTGTPADVAAACVWLASDEAGWVTGQTIGVNGGTITS